MLNTLTQIPNKKDCFVQMGLGEGRGCLPSRRRVVMTLAALGRKAMIGNH